MLQRVIDSSVAVEYLLKTKVGLSVAGTIERTDVLLAPDIIVAEIMSVLRRQVGRKELQESRALLALDDLVWWPIERVPSRSLLRFSWQFRHNVTAYDSVYVGLARQLDIPLLTADGRLARAPRLGITLEHIRMG